MDQSLSLARRAAAEALAAFALVFAGCGAIIANQHYHGALGAVGISLVFGLIIMVMIYATGHLSGAHINPSVTIAFTLTRHFSPRDAVAYIAAQLTGATACGARAARRVAKQTRAPRRDRPHGRGRQRVPLRGDPHRVSDVRDHGRRDRHPRRRCRGSDRDRRRDRPGCPIRRSGHRSVDEPRPLVRPGTRVRHLDRLLGLCRRTDHRRRSRRIRLPARPRRTTTAAETRIDGREGRERRRTFCSAACIAPAARSLGRPARARSLLGVWAGSRRRHPGRRVSAIAPGARWAGGLGRDRVIGLQLVRRFEWWSGLVRTLRAVGGAVSSSWQGESVARADGSPGCAFYR